MSRSGYSEYGIASEMNLYRANVDRAIAGKRGQKLLQEMLIALDSLSSKRLIEGDLVRSDGECCALGAVAKARRIDVTNVESYDPDSVADCFGIKRIMAAEIAYVNDEGGPFHTVETPEERFIRVRAWVVKNLKDAEP